MTAEELKRAAEAMPHSGVTCYAQWVEAAITLKRKGYTYESIHAFLKNHGEKVPANVATFKSQMSKLVRRATGTRERAPRKSTNQTI